MKSKPLIDLPRQVHAISAFDLDHTLFSENSSYRFGLYLYYKKILSFSALLFILGCHFRHKCGILPIDKLHENAFNRLFLGRFAPHVRQWALDFLEEHFQSLLYTPALDKLKKAQTAGHLTVLLSSTPDFLVEPIANRLNIPLWDATQYTVDKDHRFCHIDQLMLGEDKAHILDRLAEKYGVPRQKIYAYSDSHLDLPFLTHAGVAYGVNPNRKLRSICRRKGWEII